MATKNGRKVIQRRRARELTVRIALERRAQLARQFANRQRSLPVVRVSSGADGVVLVTRGKGKVFSILH